jgi:hypothetical protein
MTVVRLCRPHRQFDENMNVSTIQHVPQLPQKGVRPRLEGTIKQYWLAEGHGYAAKGKTRKDALENHQRVLNLLPPAADHEFSLI